MALTRLKRSLRATILGMVVNAFLAAGKLAAGLYGHSHALVADAVESMADIFTSIVVWRGLVVAEEPADEDHPYGHGKAEPLAAAIVATMLLFAAAGIVTKAVQDIHSGEKHGPRAIALVVLLAVVVIKAMLFRFVWGEAQTVDSTAVHADAWHHGSDALTSLAAAGGITIALVGGPRYESADDVAAVIAAVIITFNACLMLRPALNELMDATPNRKVVDDVRRLAGSISGVAEVEQCRVRKMGPLYYVDMHVEVDPEITVREGHAIAHQVKDTVRTRFPAVRDVLVHIEPARKVTYHPPVKTP